MAETLTTPREIDTKLAELHNKAYAAADHVGSIQSTVLHHAGAKFYYRGRRRVTDMKVAEAEQIVADALAHADEYERTHSVTEGDGWVRTDWREYKGKLMPYEIDQAREYLGKLAEARKALADIEDEIVKLDESYTGWSRFFLVTSSQGHVHSSMSCSTCRPTTTFGWLPELSGKSEEEAVKELGPALCSVCFPSAPVEWTQVKISKANANKAAH